MKDFIASVQSLALNVYHGRVKHESPVITSWIFRLHYSLNVVILLVLAFLATFQLSGKPIQCSVDPAIPADVMNTYCWIQSTYTLPDRVDEKIGRSMISPGVSSMRSEHEEVKYHKYYQWVVFFLVFEAILFYVPYYLWDTFENGRIQMLLIRGEKTTCSDTEVGPITDYLSKSYTNNNNYFRIYILCEFLNLVNVVGQIFFIDRFLGYEFSTYGIRVLEFMNQNSNRTDPMDIIFPKVTKCTFRKYGPSGNVINFDGLCILAQNIFHEKIFIFLWFWFILLATITTFGLIWRIITLSSQSVRTFSLRKRVINFNRHPDQRNDPKFDPVIRLPTVNNPKFDAIRTIMNRLSPGDWFLLYQLSKNMWPHHFRELIRDLALKFGWKEPKLEQK